MANRLETVKRKLSNSYKQLLVALAAAACLYALYTAGISKNPPGFYLDESSIAYNAFLMARTGVDEEGVAWPLYVRSYTGLFSVYANPTYIYLLAAVYLFSPPSILAARLLSASLGFAAALCLGLLAWRISGRRVTGIIVALLAMLTPWLFEVSRLVFEVALYPLTLALFLLALYRARQRWSWADCALLAASLGLLTYTYTIGRLFAPLLAFGLLIFARSRANLLGVVKTWLLFGLTLLPLLIFNRRHPGLLTERFYLISYIKPESGWGQIIPEFISHYFDNLSLYSLLLTGDPNARHHVAGMGSFLAPVMLLALLGLYQVLKYLWQESWWRFILYGVVISPVSASLTLDQFHTLRMIPYPVFLIVLTIPALQRLIDGRAARPVAPVKKGKKKKKTESAAAPTEQATFISFPARRKALIAILALTLLQALYFQYQFHRDGPGRGAAFDAGYRDLYRQAMSQPDRPIYLLDGMWGPAYIHSFWYATIEGRGTSEFIHLDYGQRPPPGALVISSEDKCTRCQIILKREQYLLYRAL